MDYFANDKIVLPERGDLLISEPYLPDPNFERTVILLCEHDENGSFGFVLNKPSEHRLSELIEGYQGPDSEVYVGGPVQQNTLHFLHSGMETFPGDKKIAEGIYWGIDFDALKVVLSTTNEEVGSPRIFVGYSGWSVGQLEEELATKSWIVHKRADAKFVFRESADILWKAALEDMGGKFRMIANYPLDPRLN
ncbi:MAG: YqgE/AlgH family protein [Cyclobacteriaceae bacterium]